MRAYCSVVVIVLFVILMLVVSSRMCIDGGGGPAVSPTLWRGNFETATPRPPVRSPEKSAEVLDTSAK